MRQLILTDNVEVVCECFGDAVFLPCLHGPSCVMGDFCFDVVILSYFLAGLRVHSVEGNTKRTITTSCGVSQREH